MPLVERSAVDAADRAARERASEVAGAKVDELRRQTEAGAGELARQIREAEERSRCATAGVEKRALEATGEAARDLAGQIERAEQRVSESTSSLLGRELEQLQERARGTAATLREGLRALDQKATRLSEELAAERAARKDEQARAAGACQQRLEEAEARWQAHALELRKENQLLAARLAELEKPRGLWALLGRIFSRRKKG
jgi:hypothetical protein